MKRFRSLAVYAVVLAFSGAVTLKSEPPDQTQGKAVVESVRGTATCFFDGVWTPLKKTMELQPGATLTTGPDSQVNLSVDGSSSEVSILADTTFALPLMKRLGSANQAATETTIEVKIGRIRGLVKKLAANSRYEIKTPLGMAGFRNEAAFEVAVQQLPDGKYKATFNSLKGEVFVSAVLNGGIQTKRLHDHESWTPGEGDVHSIPPNKLRDSFRVTFLLPYIATPCIFRSMIEKELVAASTEPLILTLLARGESYGYALIQEAKRLSEDKIEWTDGMLYPVLHRMEANRWIKSRWVKIENGRKRKYYSIKKEGRQALQEKREQWALVSSVFRGLWKEQHV